MRKYVYTLTIQAGSEWNNDVPESSLIDVDELRQEFIDVDFDETTVCLEPEQMVTMSLACGEQLPRFTDCMDPDFQAGPAVLGGIMPKRMLPVSFPRLGGIPMDGGKSITMYAPVRAGQKLSARTHLHDIYDKKGRSGRMVFIVVRTDLYDGDESLLATLDSRIVIREKPGE